MIKTLPSAPLEPDDFTAAPEWRGGTAVPGAVARVTPTGPLITREQLARHLAGPVPWRSLPDGRGLRMTAAGMEFVLDDFGGFKPDELRSAHRVLYFATRTAAEMHALWVPPLPQNEEVAEEPEPMALELRALQAEISAWAAATFEPGAHREVKELASLLWGAIMERMPVSAEKKAPAAAAAEALSADAASATSRTFAGSLAVANPGGMSGFSSPPTSPTSPPAGSAGATTTESP